MIERSLAVLLSLLVLSPSAALAQPSKAGVVTTLEGNVTARRVALPAAVPLKFKDDIFLQDTVTTGDKSLARMLLGGKAVVTVRERSVITITELPGRSTMAIETGKFGLAAAREKMRPGEELQIRTPNAIAGVRGTVVITEVTRQSAQAGGAAPAVVTRFYVLRGSITVQRLDQTTGQPIGTPVVVGAMEAATVVGGAAPTVTAISPEDVGQIIAGLQPSGVRPVGDGGQDHVKTQAIHTAVSLLTTLMGAIVAPNEATSLFDSNGLMSELSVTSPPITALTGSGEQVAAFGSVPGDATFVLPPLIVGTPSSGTTTTTAPATTPPPPAPTDTFVSLSNQSFRRFSGIFSSAATSPFVAFHRVHVTQTGTGVSFIDVETGAHISLAGPMASLVDSSVSTTGTFLLVDGALLTGTGTGAFIALDPTQIDTANSLIALTGHSTTTLGGPLLTDVGGSLTIGQDVLRVTNGSSLTATTADALIGLTATTLSAASMVSLANSTMFLAGPLLSASNSTLTLSDSLLRVGDFSFLVSTSPNELIQLAASTMSANKLVHLGLSSAIGLSGPLLGMTGSSLTVTDNFIHVASNSSSFQGGTTNPLANVVSSTLTVGQNLVEMNGGLFLTQGGLLRVENAAGPSTVTINGAFAKADDFASVIVPGSGLTNVGVNTLTINNAIAPTGTINGVPVSVSGGAFVSLGPNSGLDLFTVAAGGSAIVASGEGTLVTIDPIMLPLEGFMSFTGPTSLGTGTIATFNSGSSATPQPISPVTNQINVVVTAKEGQGILQLFGPVISMSGATLNGDGGGAPLISVSGTSLAVSGRLLEMDNSVINDSAGAAGALLSVGGSTPTFVKHFGGVPLISATSSTISLGNSVVSLIGSTADNAVLALGGPLVFGNASAFESIGAPFLNVSAGKIISRSVGPLIEIINGGATTDAVSPFINVHGLNDADPLSAVIRLDGQLFSSSSSSISGGSGGFIVVSPGTITSTAPTPLVSLTGSSFDVPGNFMTVGCVAACQSNVTLAGPLFHSTGGGTVTIGGSLLIVSATDSQVTTTSTSPFVRLTGGGTKTLASAFGAVFDLQGDATAPETDPDAPSGLSVGTGQPLQLPAILFEASSNTVNSGNISLAAPFISVDTALLAATAPLMNLTSVTMTHAAGDLISIGTNSGSGKLTASLPGDALVKLNASTLNINSGHMLNVKNGSFLNVVGSLLRVTSSSTVNISSGALVNVAGGATGSLFKLSGGSLISFGSGSNAVTINGVAPTTTIGGIPFALIGGATSGQVTVGAGFTPFAGGAPSGTGAVIVVNGSTSKVVLNP